MIKLLSSVFKEKEKARTKTKAGNCILWIRLAHILAVRWNGIVVIGRGIARVTDRGFRTPVMLLKDLQKNRCKNMITKCWIISRPRIPAIDHLTYKLGSITNRCSHAFI